MNSSNLNNISNDLYMLLLSLNKRVFNHEELLKNCTMPPSHMKVLFHIIHTGPCAISEVAKHLSISKPNMSPIIDKLVSEGFLERFQDHKDRRIIRVKSTDVACNFLRERESSIKEKLKERLAPLTDNELEEMTHCLSVMNKLVSKI